MILNLEVHPLRRDQRLFNHYQEVIVIQNLNKKAIITILPTFSL